MAKILIVEDELVIALDMADQLRDAGFEVVGYAASVDGAVSIAKFAKPDVAIVDIHLHGELDGIEGAKLLRRAGVKVIFIFSLGPSKGSGLSGYVSGAGCPFSVSLIGLLLC